MYCSKCGAANQTEKAYCKSCGEWLPAKSRDVFGGDTPQQMITTSLFMSAISTLAALFSGLALLLTYFGTDDAKWAVYVAGGFCFCIAGWQASSFFVTLRLRHRLNKSREAVSTPAEWSEVRSAPALNPGDMSSFVGAHSVTEITTELLNHVGSPNRDTKSVL